MRQISDLRTFCLLGLLCHRGRIQLTFRKYLLRFQQSAIAKVVRHHDRRIPPIQSQSDSSITSMLKASFCKVLKSVVKAQRGKVQSSNRLWVVSCGNIIVAVDLHTRSCSHLLSVDPAQWHPQTCHSNLQSSLGRGSQPNSPTAGMIIVYKTKPCLPLKLRNAKQSQGHITIITIITITTWITGNATTVAPRIRVGITKLHCLAFRRSCDLGRVKWREPRGIRVM